MQITVTKMCSKAPVCHLGMCAHLGTFVYRLFTNLIMRVRIVVTLYQLLRANITSFYLCSHFVNGSVNVFFSFFAFFFWFIIFYFIFLYWNKFLTLTNRLKSICWCLNFLGDKITYFEHADMYVYVYVPTRM